MIDEAPIDPSFRHSFGYQHAVEMREIRMELRAKGITDPTKLQFAAVDAYIKRHRNDPSFAERQAFWRAFADPPKSKAHLSFTLEEVERLVEHFAGANDPVAQSIYQKALASLPHPGERE